MSAELVQPAAPATTVGEPPRPRLRCIIVTYNSADHLDALLASLRDAGAGLEVATVVVDNGSQDSTVALARAHPSAPVVLRSGGNLGYSGGINIGLALVQPGECVAVLNPDLTLEPLALTRLVEALGESGVGIAVPSILEPDGDRPPHLRREPGVLRSLGDVLFGARAPRRPRFLTEYLRRAEDYRTAHNVDWASGAVLVVAPQCHEAVGQWPADTYFLYAEETAYCRRARDRGFLIRYVPSARARHHGGGSGTSPELLALMSVNRLRYFAEHHGGLSSGAYRATLLLGHLLRSRSRDHRFAMRVLSDRSRWPSLPGGHLE